MPTRGQQARKPTSIQGHVFQTKNASHIAYTVSSTVAGVVAVMSVPCVLGVPAEQPATAAVGARLGMGEDIVERLTKQIDGFFLI